MKQELNELNQPVGLRVPDWQRPGTPKLEVMEGRYCRVEPIDPDRHSAELFEANGHDEKGLIWTYLPYGPFDSPESFKAWMSNDCTKSDPQFYAIIDLAHNKAVGIASFLRIDPRNGSIEVGHINYSPLLQRKPAATEAMYLMMAHAFALGYRRYEWKCNALNAPSRSAAQRLGLSFEGVFRQATVVKGRNRDTAWYAAIDEEWPAIKDAFQRWLHPDNFDSDGQQKTRLTELTSPILKHRG